MTPLDALNEAIRVAGSQALLAEKIGTTQPRISEWVKKSKQVGSPQFVRAIEEQTGVSRHLLRPDVFGPAESDVAA